MTPFRLRERARAAVRRWLGAEAPVRLVHHPSYRIPLAQAMGPPMDARRADDALTWALWSGLVDEAHVHVPDEVPWALCELVHDPAWLAALDRPETLAHVLGTDPERIPVAALLETWRRATGGTVLAAGLARASGDRVVNLLGGFHHAEPAKGGGFCAINDVAVAVAAARRDGLRGRVVIVDLDAHPPDGLAACLGDDPDVVIRSISTASAWEVPPVRRADLRDTRIPAGSTDGAYLEALDRLLRDLPPATLAFYLAGADPVAGDRLGGLAVSPGGLRERDRRVFAALGEAPTVVLPAGGYSPEVWRVLAGTVAAAAGDPREIPPSFDPLRHRTLARSRTLSARDLAGRDDDVLITEEELLGTMRTALADPEPRLLGYYTRHGLELALTVHGYLPTLERMGFRGLRVDISTGQGPDRMRLTAALPGDPAALLVDLAVSVRPVPAGGPRQWRTLFVEWLELRDPRVAFSAARPQLPGQQRPGLGMAEETMQLLAVAATRLGLAGVSFVPAHYHVAWISRSRFQLVDPEARGRFEALVRHTAALPLAEVSRRLGTVGWPLEDGETLRWDPVEMVFPLDEGLRAWLEAGADAATAARRRLRDRLG